MSQSCNRGLAFPPTQLPGHICDRRAGQQAQHPGAILQSYGLDETLVQVMEGDGITDNCGVMGTADQGVTGTAVRISVRQTVHCKGQFLFQLATLNPSLTCRH